MKWRLSVVMLVLMGCRVWAQEPPVATPLTDAGDMMGTSHVVFPSDAVAPPSSSPLSGNHNFPTFINWMSNPERNIDPRAMTAIYPIFLDAKVSGTAPIPDTSGQVYGLALTLALSDRLAFGLNQGGYAYMSLTRNESARIAAFRQIIAQQDPTGRFADVEAGGDRQGFLNIGGFMQYTLIQNVEAQFLLTAGLEITSPSGSTDVFQGKGPWLMTPYFTAGKGFGDYHVLTTAGYEFPFAGASGGERGLFYANLHLDRRCFGWLYPLVEFNWTYQTQNVSFGLPTRAGLIDFGNFDFQGNVLTMAVGANAVLIPERLEFGGVYSVLLASQHDFNANGLLVKMTLRF
jgi:hypothetical protein